MGAVEELVSRHMEDWAKLLRRRAGPRQARSRGAGSSTGSGVHRSGSLAFDAGCFRGAAGLLKSMLPRLPALPSGGSGARPHRVTTPSINRSCGLWLNTGGAKWRSWRKSAYRRTEAPELRRHSKAQNNPLAWWPELVVGEHGEPSFRVQEDPAVKQAASFEASAKELLRRTLEIESLCQSVEGGGESKVGDLTIQRLVQEACYSVWSAQAEGNPVAFVCSETLLTTSAPLEAVLWAIYGVEERLAWDGKTFAEYAVLRAAAPQAESQAVGDVIYCRMPAPAGMSSREVVQERFLVPVPGGGYGIVMRSPSAQCASALGKPPSRGSVRMETLLSGFLLRPLAQGGIKLTAMSQTDLGGSVPQWVQSMAKRAGNKKALEWARSLQAHCDGRMVDARPPNFQVVAPHEKDADRVHATVEATAGGADKVQGALVASGGGKRASAAVYLAMVALLIFWLTAPWD